MKNNRGIRIASLLMAMLIVGMFAVAPAIACVPGESFGCGTNSNNIDNVDVIELNGAEKEKFIDIVLENENIKSLQNELNKQGFEETNFAAYSKITTLDDGSVFETQFAIIKFESFEKGFKELVYVHDKQTGENSVLLAPETNIDQNEIKIGGTNTKVYQANEINVYELFNTKPHKLPVPLLRYNNAEDDLKNEIESIANKANVKSDDTIVGILKYNNQKILLVDSVDTVTEIVADAQENIVAIYQLEPKLIGSKEYINEESSISVKTIIDLYQLDITVPNGKSGSIEILTTDVITAENSAWKELGLGCPICIIVNKDMNVIAKGTFYIDYGNEVESVIQQSISETNCNACLSKCSFDRSESGGAPERQVDATGIWAANLAPVTANFEIYSWVSVNKYGTMDSGASDDSWLTPGFGCYGP